MTTLPDAITLDHETAHDDDAPTWSDRDAPATRVHLPVVGRTRKKTLHPARGAKGPLFSEALLYPAEELESYERPRTRTDCLPGGCNEARPCPWVSCWWHLAIDVADNGSVTINRPDVEVWEMAETCGADIADRGGVTLEEIGEVMNLTRERIRQIETHAKAVLKLARETAPLREHLVDDPSPHDYVDHDAGMMPPPGAARCSARSTADAVDDLLRVSPNDDGGER